MAERASTTVSTAKERGSNNTQPVKLPSLNSTGPGHLVDDCLANRPPAKPATKGL